MSSKKGTNVPAIVEPNRDGLISVPLATRPKPQEIPSYLPSFQAHAIEVALELLDDKSLLQSNALASSGIEETLQRLVTSLSTEINFIRIPVVWAACESLANVVNVSKEQLLNEKLEKIEELTKTVGIFLSHFELASHLNEAHRRVALGDDQIDEALFVDIDERVMQFDASRAKVYSDAVERSNRISAVFHLPRGVVPQITVFLYKLFQSFFEGFEAISKQAFKAGGALFGAYVGLSLLGQNPSEVVRAISEFVRTLQ